MRRNLILHNAARVALALGVAVMVGGFWYIQQQKVGDLQRQIDQLPNGKDKVSLVKDRIALENTINGSVIQTVGGLLLFVTAYVSLQNLKATQRNVLVAEEKQVTERFTQAINQLGSKEITVRVGGIYALERIARDSEKDHWTIMEVLASFVQEKLRLPSSEKLEEEEEQPLGKILKDVQAALTVMGRRESGRSEPGSIDLSGANLNGANLRDLRINNLPTILE
jgi:hypothetical protein